MGTKFTVYDSGLNPVKTTGSLEADNLRQELAAICYVSQGRPLKCTCGIDCETGLWKGLFIERSTCEQPCLVCGLSPPTQIFSCLLSHPGDQCFGIQGPP